jgi:hypothetical protein
MTDHYLVGRLRPVGVPARPVPRRARAAREVDQVPHQVGAALDEESERLLAAPPVHVGSRPRAVCRYGSRIGLASERLAVCQKSQ